MYLNLSEREVFGEINLGIGNEFCSNLFLEIVELFLL